ncbi:MAG: 6-bladed beta-propeller [Deltaproteobacteria bacterium]|nr:6-bladed beta-propeller [Deltaproteobacteria bacterium]
MSLGKMGMKDGWRAAAHGALRLAFTLVFALLAAALSGCATAQFHEDRTQPKGLIWPRPPAPARIQYLGMIERPQDIGANSGFFSRLANFVFGAKVNDILKPYGVTGDSADRLIVADTGLKRVHVFDIKEKDYTYIESYGDELLASPIAAAVDGSDNIYITDSVLGKVLVFTPSGKPRTEFKAGARPTGIAIDKTAGRVYVSDTAAHSVGVYDLNGGLVKTMGHFGAGLGEFNHPVDLFVDPAGDLYVNDTINYRVQIFDNAGAFLTQFGRHGDGTGDFGMPKGVSADNEGNVYVVDAVFDTVQIFNRDGTFLLNFGSVGSDAGAFWLPSGIYIDRSGKIYVADTFNRRVQIFEYLGGS